MEKKSWKWIWVWGSISACGLAVVILLTVIIDPFFQYHEPLEGFPYIVDNQLSQNPGMAEHFNYDAVMLGSSMTVNFETEWFEELYGEQMVKLCYNGAYPHDQFRIMNLVFERGREIKTVYLGIDPIAYSAELTQTKFPLPEYLYDYYYINDASYVLNKDVLLDYILKPIASPSHKTNMSQVYKQWWTDEYYNLDTVLYQYTEPEIVEEPVEIDAFSDSTMQNMQSNIIPFIAANPDTEFVIFFPPYSILFWHDMILENRLDATLRQMEVIVRSLLSYDNVKIYLFSDRENIICDFNQYADYTHYHTRINRYMAECFGGDECRIMNEQELHNRLQDLKQLALQYDFSAILWK